jgi:hypothetical protein
MIKPQDGEMNYKEIEELSWYYMFISACIPEDKRNMLKEKWNNAGGYQVIPWWKFVMENTRIELDMK